MNDSVEEAEWVHGLLGVIMDHSDLSNNIVHELIKAKEFLFNNFRVRSDDFHDGSFGNWMVEVLVLVVPLNC